MARQKGSANFSGTIEVLAGGPLDARSKVPTKADLTVASNFPYPYVGMQVFVVSELKRYTLIGDDVTVEENWQEDGSGGSSVPEGGTTGQALIKLSNDDGDAGWGNVISTSQKGVADGVAELDSNGKVPASQLPSYVDDVIEGYYNSTNDRFYEESTFTTLIPPESGKSWVDIAGNKSYRWSGSAYVRVDEGVQLGETSDTAYRGDRGKTAYDFSQAPYTSTPAMNGNGSAGSSTAWAKGDHVHPKDTTKADKVSGAVNGDVPLLNSSGNLTDSGMKPGLDTTDWLDIVTPLPGQPTEGIIISPEERQVGWYYNMDGSGTKKPLYQKTIVNTMPTCTTQGTFVNKSVDIGASIDKFLGLKCILEGSGSGSTSWFNGVFYELLTAPSFRADGSQNACGIIFGRSSSADTPNIVELQNGIPGYSGMTVYITIQYTKTTDTYA